MSSSDLPTDQSSCCLGRPSPALVTESRGHTLTLKATHTAVIAFLVIVASSDRVGENRRRTGKRREVFVSDSNDFQSPRCKDRVQI